MPLLAGARDLKLDPVDGDLVVDGGDLAQVKDAEAIVQACTLALSLFRGEWFLDEALGVPYYESVLVKNPNLAAIREIYRRKLLSVDGVDEVLSLNLDYNRSTRKLLIAWRVSSAFGELSGSRKV
jgi:hypothetical protein